MSDANADEADTGTLSRVGQFTADPTSRRTNTECTPPLLLHLDPASEDQRDIVETSGSKPAMDSHAEVRATHRRNGLRWSAHLDLSCILAPKDI